MPSGCKVPTKKRLSPSPGFLRKHRTRKRLNKSKDVSPTNAPWTSPTTPTRALRAAPTLALDPRNLSLDNARSSSSVLPPERQEVSSAAEEKHSADFVFKPEQKSVVGSAVKQETIDFQLTVSDPSQGFLLPPLFLDKIAQGAKPTLLSLRKIITPPPPYSSLSKEMQAFESTHQKQISVFYPQNSPSTSSTSLETPLKTLRRLPSRLPRRIHRCEKMAIKSSERLSTLSLPSVFERDTNGRRFFSPELIERSSYTADSSNKEKVFKGLVSEKDHKTDVLKHQLLLCKPEKSPKNPREIITLSARILSGPKDDEFRTKVKALLESLFFANTPARLIVRPAAQNLGICCLGISQFTSFTVENRGLVSASVMIETPEELRKQVRIIKPTFTRIHPGENRKVSVVLRFRKSILWNARKFLCPITGIIQFPITVVTSCKQSTLQQHEQKSPVLQILAAVTAPVLELSPTTLDLGTVLIKQCVSTEIRLTNKSKLPQRYGFLNLPEGVSIEPGGGFGEILPDETLLFKMLYKPTNTVEGRRHFSFHVDTVMGLASQRCLKLPKPRTGYTQQISAVKSAYTCTATVTVNVVNPRLHMSVSSVRFPATPEGSYSITYLSMACSAREAHFVFTTSDSQLQISPPSGSLHIGQVIKLTALFRPKPGAVESTLREDQVIHCFADTRISPEDPWRQEVSLLHVTCPIVEAALQPMFQSVDFRGILPGCSARRIAYITNVSSSWLRVRPNLPRPCSSFWWPGLNVILPPGYVIRLPITCCISNCELRQGQLDLSETFQVKYWELEDFDSNITNCGPGLVNLQLRLLPD